MDEKLREFLDSQDWVDLTKRLTSAALGLMKQYGMTQRGSPEEFNDKAIDYAHETMCKAYDACRNTLLGRFNPSRGDQAISVEVRFLRYLKDSILRRLITDDAAKFTRRQKWTAPIEDAHSITVEMEESASLTLTELVCEADDELSSFISAAVKQLEDDQERTKINWVKLRESTGLTRHACDQLRVRLLEHLTKLLLAQPA